jgi:hypothetical protein
MSDKISVKDAQAEINGLLVAEICRDFGINFRDVYPEHILARGVGPEQAFIGLAIKRGRLALPAVQPDAAAIRKEALSEAISHARQALVDAAHTYGGAKASAMFTAETHVTAALYKLMNSTGKEVMPNGSDRTAADIGPGDQAVAGAVPVTVQEAIEAAYIAGAMDVHNNWQADRAPDFSEAARDYAAAPTREAGGMEELISDARLECEALCARFSAGEASEKEVVDTLRKVARDAERLAVLLREAKGKAPYIVAEEWAERMRHLDDGVTPAAGFVIPFGDAASRHIESALAARAALTGKADT